MGDFFQHLLILSQIESNTQIFLNINHRNHLICFYTAAAYP